MSTVNDTKNVLQSRKNGGANTPVKKGDNVISLIRKMQPQFEMALSKSFSPERFVRIALTAIKSNPDLAKCTQESLFGALLTSAQLSLEPNSPLAQAYLIPFKVKGVMTCQFIIGYRGLKDLFYRSKEALTLDAHEVYENDEFVYEYGMEPKLKHVPTLGERGDVIAFYAVAHMKNGGSIFVVLSKSDVEKIRKSSASQLDYSQKPYRPSEKPKGVWKDNYVEMGKKSAIRRISKLIPMATDLATNIENDGSVKHVSAEKMLSGEKVDANEIPDVQFDITNDPGDDSGENGSKPEEKKSTKSKSDPAENKRLKDEIDDLWKYLEQMGIEGYMTGPDFDKIWKKITRNSDYFKCVATDKLKLFRDHLAEKKAEVE